MITCVCCLPSLHKDNNQHEHILCVYTYTHTYFLFYNDTCIQCNIINVLCLEGLWIYIYIYISKQWLNHDKINH